MRSVVAAALLAFPLLVPVEASAGGALVKFFVTDYRLKVNAESAGKIELTLRGRASVYGSDKIEFEWKVADATPYLALLGACSVGTLNGAVNVDDDVEGEGKIEGAGPIAELSCRVILK